MVLTWWGGRIGRGGEVVVGVVGVFEGDSLRVVRRRRRRNARVCLPRQPGKAHSSQGAGASQPR